MKVNYNRTTFEKLMDALEEAFLAGRTIKNIEMTIDEWKHVMKSYSNPKFVMAVSKKVYIKNIETVMETDTPLKAHINYMVVEHPHQQSANLNFVTVIIL
jgi:GTP cyclohydrolase FolE2